MNKIWINNFEKKVEEIRNLHRKLEFTFSLDEEFEDDLPKFLKSITSYELNNLIERIESNMVEKDQALVKLFTVHAYKGLEDEFVRLSDDIERDEETVYYVALTRGFKRILTPNDIEYFEKLFTEQKTLKEPEEEAKEAEKAKVKKNSNKCKCGGCINREHLIGEFMTKMGRRLWCQDCAQFGCMCKGDPYGSPFDPHH
jgi:ATP-dependent exoDNAse (exonuclease V) beta subunit